MKSRVWLRDAHAGLFAPLGFLSLIPGAARFHQWTPTRFPAGARSTLTSRVYRIALHSPNLLLVDMPRATGEPDSPHAAPMSIDPARRDVLLASAPWTEIGRASCRERV